MTERQDNSVDGMAQRAGDASATLVAGGQRADPRFFYTPTCLTDVDPNSEIAQDEVFGPVLAVIAVDDDEGAARIATIYGVAGAVFSCDRDRAVALVRRIRSGSFAINGGNHFLPNSRFVASKQSGVGREMGIPGLEEFVERKTFGTVVG